MTITTTKLKDGRFRFAAYCACGESMHGTTSAGGLHAVRDAWAKAHDTPACGPASRAACAKARAKSWRESGAA